MDPYEEEVCAYVVRVRKNCDAVGIYVAPSIWHLWNLVEEMVDPRACQFAELPPLGGIAWPSGIAWPAQEYEWGESEEMDTTGGQLTDGWWKAIFEGEVT